MVRMMAAEFSRKAAIGLGVAVLALMAAPAVADVKAGVDAWSAGDFSRAVVEWQGPAAAGDPDALFNLAQAYRLGRGVEIDNARARKLYEQAASLGPGGEDERVVDRGAGDLVHALVVEGLRLIDEAGQVAGRAGGGERARHGEQHQLAAGGVLGERERLHGALDEVVQGDGGQGLAGLDRHGAGSRAGSGRAV